MKFDHNSDDVMGAMYLSHDDLEACIYFIAKSRGNLKTNSELVELICERMSLNDEDFNKLIAYLSIRGAFVFIKDTMTSHVRDAMSGHTEVGAIKISEADLKKLKRVLDGMIKEKKEDCENCDEKDTCEIKDKVEKKEDCDT